MDLEVHAPAPESRAICGPPGGGDKKLPEVRAGDATRSDARRRCDGLKSNSGRRPEGLSFSGISGERYQRTTAYPHFDPHSICSAAEKERPRERHSRSPTRC